MLAQYDVGSMPIVDGDNLVGVITDRDIVVSGLAEGHVPQPRQCRDLRPTTDVVTVDRQDDAKAVASVLADNQIRRVPVLEDGRVIGVISQADVALELDNSTAGEVVEQISK